MKDANKKPISVVNKFAIMKNAFIQIQDEAPPQIHLEQKLK